MTDITLSRHPLATELVEELGEPNLSLVQKREIVRQLSYILAVEMTSAPWPSRQQARPLSGVFAKAGAARAPVLLMPVQNAGLDLLPGFEALFPEREVSLINYSCDRETGVPLETVVDLPANLDRPIVVLDPVLGEGHAALAAIEALKDRGADINDIRYVTVLAGRKGVEMLGKTYPSLVIHGAATGKQGPNRGVGKPALTGVRA